MRGGGGGIKYFYMGAGGTNADGGVPPPIQPHSGEP